MTSKVATFKKFKMATTLATFKKKSKWQPKYLHLKNIKMANKVVIFKENSKCETK